MFSLHPETLLSYSQKLVSDPEFAFGKGRVSSQNRCFRTGTGVEVLEVTILVPRKMLQVSKKYW